MDVSTFFLTLPPGEINFLTFEAAFPVIWSSRPLFLEPFQCPIGLETVQYLIRFPATFTLIFSPERFFRR